jgi:Domain of unknown function (DUF3362)
MSPCMKSPAGRFPSSPNSSTNERTVRITDAVPAIASEDLVQNGHDIATRMYYTGLVPFTGEAVYVAKRLRDRKLQRALLQFFKPENYFEVRQALSAAGRTELIGSGCDALITAQPPKAAIHARMAKARRELTEGRYVHTVAAESQPERAPVKPPPRSATPGAGGYRPHRKSTRRRPR